MFSRVKPGNRRPMEKLLLALFKAVMDTSNDPLAIVPAVLAVMLMDDSNTKVKSVPVIYK